MERGLTDSSFDWGNADTNEEMDFEDTSWIRNMQKVESADNAIVSCNSVKDYNECMTKYKTAKNIILMFSTSWCGPCRSITPRIERFLQDNNKDLVVLKIDGDKCRAVLKKFNVSAFPTFVLVKEDKSIENTIVGADWERIKKYCESCSDKEKVAEPSKKPEETLTPDSSINKDIDSKN